MAKLEKLELSGIRSFGPHDDNKQSLKFTSPVTLILGQNGCGKTTIIEALRYAFTGDYPGGSNSGQGFVNDPKMSGKASTKGSIKLRFTETRGSVVTVSRVVEVSTTSMNNLKFQAKNASLKVVTPGGEERSSSGRCLDISVECCQFMNVSPAILSNVVFCHQENSLWPLDEGKKLKERFDEIFDAQKYTQCSDVLRKTIKKYVEQIKILGVRVAYAESRKKEVEKENVVLREKEEKLESLLKSVDDKKRDIEPVKTRLREILELENNMSDLNKELATKEEQKRGLLEQQRTIKQNLASVFAGTDEELQEEIRTFDTNNEREKHVIRELEKRKLDIDTRMRAIAVEIQESLSKTARLEQKKTQYGDKCNQRKNLIEAAKTKLKLPSISDADILTNAEKVIRSLQSALTSCETSLNSIIEEAESEESALQKGVDGARESVVSTKQSLDSMSREIKNSESKIEHLSNELSNLGAADETLKGVTSKLENLERTMYKLRENFNDTAEAEKIQVCKAEISTKERTLDRLEADYRILQQNDIIEGKMETEKTLINSKNKEITKIKNKHQQNLRFLFAANVPESGLKDAVDKIQRVDEKLLKNLTDRINSKQREVTTLETQLKHQVEKVKNMESELRSKEQKIYDTCGDDSFDDTLSRVCDRKDRLLHDRGQYKSAKLFYEQFVEEFRKDQPCCPICDTDFTHNKNNIGSIISKLKLKIEKLPKQLLRVEKDLEKEEETYVNLQQLKVVNDDIAILKLNTLPDLRQKKGTLETNLKGATQELENLRNELESPQKRVDICRSLISDMASLDQFVIDVQRSKKTYDTLHTNLVQVTSNKSKQEVEQEIDHLKSDINELRNTVEAQEKKLNAHKDRLHKMGQERTTHMSNQMRVKEALMNKPALEAQKDELTSKVEKLKEEVDDLKASLLLCEAELNDMIKLKSTTVSKNKEKIQRERIAFQVNKNLISDIVKIQAEIDEYLKDRIEFQLEQIEEDLVSMKEREVKLEEAKNKVIDAFTTKKEDLAKREINFRELKDNVTLREKIKQTHRLEEEINGLKTKIGGLNHRTIQEEKVRLSKQHADIEKQLNSISGQINELTTVIEEKREILNQPENKQALSHYKNQFCELKILEKIVKDLTKYMEVFEKCVMDFHKSKMTHINKTIRDLWRQIYRGNDVDYIEIKTDHSGGNIKRRSYNYKVVQVKKGVELDMRGRCSAGQKVLACLIIRIALAETLSGNCGILALDEPTTNLDKENILSLSEALSAIINTRFNERNFQLLVITHDEEFLTTLTRVQGVEHFHRVSRDNNGFSIIKREQA